MIQIPESNIARVYILLGQSNMVGSFNWSSWLITPSNLFIYNSNWYNTLIEWQNNYWNSWFWPEVSFGKKMVEETWKDIYILKYAVWWTGLYERTNWLDWNVKSTGELYDWVISRIEDSINKLRTQGKVPLFSWILWMQGEQDSTIVQESKSYYKNFSEVVNWIKEYIWNEILFMSYWLVNSWISWLTYPWRDIVRDHQKAYFLNNKDAYYIVNDSLTTVDGVHYDKDSMIEIWEKFADIYKSIV